MPLLLKHICDVCGKPFEPGRMLIMTATVHDKTLAFSKVPHELLQADSFFLCSVDCAGKALSRWSEWGRIESTLRATTREALEKAGVRNEI